MENQYFLLLTFLKQIFVQQRKVKYAICANSFVAASEMRLLQGPQLKTRQRPSNLNLVSLYYI